VFAVTDRFLRPLFAAVPGRPSAKGLFDSLPEFAGSGGLCGVAVGLFAGQDEPWRVAFFDDLVCAGVAGPDGLKSWLHTGRVDELFEKAFESLPGCPVASGGALYIEADERGVIEPEQECLVLELLDAVARPRLGTVLVDLAFDYGDHAHFPEGVLAYVDDDRGRHLLLQARLPGGRWRLWWAPGDPAKIAEVVGRRVLGRV
jgi:hypothetical protein